MQVKIKMFGAFRVLGETITLETNDNATIEQLSTIMQASLPSTDLVQLLKLSKFANEHEVLADDAICDPAQILAILPPVSGG